MSNNYFDDDVDEAFDELSRYLHSDWPSGCGYLSTIRAAFGERVTVPTSLEKQIAEAEDLIATIGDVDYKYNGEMYIQCETQGTQTRVSPNE